MQIFVKSQSGSRVYSIAKEDTVSDLQEQIS